MMTTCPTCAVPLSGHWACNICKCFGHANVICKYDKSICTTCEGALKKQGKRHCKRCGKIKLISQFPLYGRRTCRACRNQERAALRQANPEREKATARRYNRKRRAQDPEKAREATRASYRRHRDKRIAANRERYKKNRAYHSVYAKAYWEKNRESLIQKKRDYRRKRKLVILQEMQAALR